MSQATNSNSTLKQEPLRREASTSNRTRWTLKYSSIKLETYKACHYGTFPEAVFIVFLLVLAMPGHQYITNQFLDQFLAPVNICSCNMFFVTMSVFIHELITENNHS